ncbi:MAG: YceD family protein [Pararhodobacter sp.]
MPPHSASPRALPPCTDTTMPLRVSELSARKAQAFQIRPDAAARRALAEALGLLALRKCDFRGTLAPEGRHDWRLEGRLGATVVQPCVISAEPVSTRIDVDVTRRFLRDMPEPEATEAEIPDDDTLEPLGAVIDPGQVMSEALALALPDYPRAAGASLDAAGVPPPGAAPIDDTRPNPFAALARLKPGADEHPDGRADEDEPTPAPAASERPEKPQ